MEIPAIKMPDGRAGEVTAWQPGEDSRAVLWDLDGTLLDTNRYHFLAWRSTMAAEGYDITFERFALTFGLRNEQVLEVFCGSGIAAADVSRIAAAKESLYRRMVREEPPGLLPGVAGTMAGLRATGWRQALATMTPRPNVEVLLDVLGLADAFDAVISGDDVTRGKPAPDVFLAAAGHLAVPARLCVVVEDSSAGVEAARRAGMACIAVSTSEPALPASIVVPSLDRLPPGTFERLITPRGA